MKKYIIVVKSFNDHYVNHEFDNFSTAFRWFTNERNLATYDDYWEFIANDWEDLYCFDENDICSYIVHCDLHTRKVSIY